MQLKNVDIYIYNLDNDGHFESLGVINEFTSLIWPDKFNGYTSFELNAPVTKENKDLIKKGNYVWCGGDNAAIIEIINSETNEEGQKVYKVKGRTLEMLLTTRIIWGTYSCVNKPSSTVMYEIVDEQCVNPLVYPADRKIPFLECAEDDGIGKIISFQKTGTEVYDALQNISTDAELGFDILFRPREKKLIFKVTEGVDRSKISSLEEASHAVIFSTDLEDILSSSYYTNNEGLKTLALVAGEGTGAERKSIISGSSISKGFLRRELYVDARDIQSEVQRTTTGEDGREDTETIIINHDEYNDLLDDRGKEKLAEHVVVESFEAKIRVTGDVQYEYGKHYNRGDIVLIQDTDLGVQVAAKVTEVSENYDDDYELIITFGYSLPTLVEKIKRQIL